MSTNGMMSNSGASQWKERARELYHHCHRLPARVWALALTLVMLGVAYAPNFRDLSRIWDGDPNYSHGWLVVPIAVVILWRRLADTPATPLSGDVPMSWLGWIFLTALLAVRAIAYEQNSQWVESATLMPALASITWTFGGWPLLRRVWPAIAFLVFLLPLPGAINELMALPLQSIAAAGSCYLLQLSGFWAIREGNVINLATPNGPTIPMDVALACNGLRMLMTMAATISATIVVFPMQNWKRITLLLSTVPIALLSNMLRIVTTGWCYFLFTGSNQKAWAHDFSGWLMMPLALVLVGMETLLLSWLVPDKTAEDIDDLKPVIPLISGKMSGKKQKQNTDLDELA